MKQKVYFLVSLILTIIFGAIAFFPSITGFSIYSGSYNNYLKLNIILFLISLVFLIKTTSTLVRSKRLEDYVDEITNTDKTGKHIKNWSVYSGGVEMYASNIPSSYKGEKITESERDKPIEKIWLESKENGGKFNKEDLENTFDKMYDEISNRGRTVIAPTASRYLSKLLRKKATEHKNVKLEEYSGEKMSDALFKYLIRDLDIRGRKSLSHASKIPRKKSEFRYFILRPVK